MHRRTSGPQALLAEHALGGLFPGVAWRPEADVDMHQFIPRPYEIPMSTMWELPDITGVDADPNARILMIRAHTW